MAGKDRVVRRVDEVNPNIVKGGGQLIQSNEAPVATPAFPSAPPPENVTVASGQALLRTTYTPKVLVGVSWSPPINLLPEIYSIEAAEDVNFNVKLQRWTTTITSGVIELNPDKDYWVRVQAIVRGVYSEYGYPDNYPVASVHTMDDTTPPGAVTGVTTNWSTGDLRFTWTNPSSDNFFQTRIRIYDTFGGTLYREDYVVGNPGSTSSYVFTVAMNNDATGNSPLTSVYYDLLAYSLAGVPAASSATGTVTKSKPALPTGLTSTWSGDDGTYDEGVTFSWNAVGIDNTYRIIIDGVTKNTPRVLYHYAYSENVSDHRPTLVSGDHTLSYTVQAVDPLGQTSGGASGTATNLAPSSSNLNLSYVPGFSSLFAEVRPTTEIKDLYGYRWVLKSGGANVHSVLTFTPEVTFPSLNGVYTLELYAIDLFGRKSTTISGINIVMDGLTIEQLRAETQYTNSIGTNPTTLNGLKDNNLLTSVVTLSSGTTWRWTKAERPLLDRYHAITIAVSGAATNLPFVYYGVSSDDSTYRWFAGPLTGTNGITMTEHATETIAQASGIRLTTNINRFDLPTIAEGRYVKMGHRGNIHNLTEYYPRRIIQSDDIEAESIRAINIAAQTITADKIQVFSLTAGRATISGILSIGLNGGLYQGTGDFNTPITGLKLWNSSGIGRLTLYSGGLVTVETDTSGRLTAGRGVVRLDREGVEFTAGSFSFDLENISPVIVPKVFGIQWVASGVSTQDATIYGSTSGQLLMLGEQITLAFPVSSTDSYGINIDSGAVRINHDVVSLGYDNLDAALTITSSVSSAGSTVQADGPISSNSNITTLGTNAGFVFEDRTSGQDWQLYGSVSVARLYNGTRDVITITDAGATSILQENSDTAAVVSILQLVRRNDGTGTVGAGFGGQIPFFLDTNGGSDRTAGNIQVLWTDATDTTRNADMRFFAYDGNGATTNARECFRIGSTAANVAGIGFFGNGVAARQTVTGTITGGTLAQLQAWANSLMDALAAYSFVTDSTT